MRFLRLTRGIKGRAISLCYQGVGECWVFNRGSAQSVVCETGGCRMRGLNDSHVRGWKMVIDAVHC